MCCNKGTLHCQDAACSSWSLNGNIIGTAVTVAKSYRSIKYEIHLWNIKHRLVGRFVLIITKRWMVLASQHAKRGMFFNSYKEEETRCIFLHHPQVPQRAKAQPVKCFWAWTIILLATPLPTGKCLERFPHSLPRKAPRRFQIEKSVAKRVIYFMLKHIL